MMRMSKCCMEMIEVHIHMNATFKICSSKFFKEREREMSEYGDEGVHHRVHTQTSDAGFF